MQQLKIGQVSTSSSGGAGIAALRLSNALCGIGQESKVIHIENASFSLPKRFSSKILTGIQKSNTRKVYGIATPISISKIDRERLLRDFDLLHIHNWYNQMSLADLDYLGKRIPLVFTLHDERLLTGGCHMSLGCNNFIEVCSACPAVFVGQPLISHSKKSLSEAFERIEKFAVISPSAWMGNQWLNAYPAYKTQLNLIPNIIQYPPNFAQKETNTNSFKIFFASASLETPVKGLNLLLDSIRNANIDQKVQLILAGAGKRKVSSKNIEVITLGQLHTNQLYEEMAKADLLVVPSKSENSPNIIAEGQLLGVPILASNVGGIPELITHGVTGFLSEPTVEAFSEQLSALCNGLTSRDVVESAKFAAAKRWNNEGNTKMHLQIYRNLL